MVSGLILDSGYCLCGDSVHLSMYMPVSFKLSSFLSAFEKKMPEGGLFILYVCVCVHNGLLF